MTFVVIGILIGMLSITLPNYIRKRMELNTLLDAICNRSKEKSQQLVISYAYKPLLKHPDVITKHVWK